MQSLQDSGWKIIDYTSARYIEHPDNDHARSQHEHHHEMIGQELDNVVAVMNDEFYYTSKNKLTSIARENLSYYFPTKMLYQNISRTKKKLHIVIINNQHLLDNVLRILNAEEYM